jgi:serine phosphatase RsbU (regulator of sigma subunit)
VAETRQARAGIPISVKLILATSIVIAAAVFTATWFSQTSISDLTEKQVAARRASGEKSIVRESELLVQAVANTLVIPMSNSMFGEVPNNLEDVLAADKKGENRVEWLLAYEPAGKTVLGATPGAPAKVDELDRILKDGIKSTANKVVHAKLQGSSWVYTTPIELGGTTHGHLYMGVSTAGLEKELTASLEQSKARAQATRNRVWLVGLLVLAIGVVLAALQGVRLAGPIKVLTRQAERIAGGDLSHRVPHTRRDELGVLAGSFNFMADQIKLLLVEQAQKASLEKEMSLARQVQQAMLPSEALDEHGSLKIVGYCMPASSCGGDWWTYRKLSNGRMLLVVGDATGHGIHSAMIAATARGAVEALSGIDERLLTPEQVLRAIDSAIRQVGDHNVLMTAFACVFDSSNGILHYANAGQNFPYVIKLGAASRVLEEASIIAASGNPLGDRNIAIEIRRGSLQLRPGDLFVCFTDGVVERANPAGKLFGDRRLRGALTGQKLTDGRSLTALRDQVVQTLERYAEGAIAEDDITLVLCQFDPAMMRRESSGRGAA